MAMRTPAKDDLLVAFEELIDRIGKEVADKSLSPTLRELLVMWQAGVDSHQRHMTHLVTGLAERLNRIEETLSRTRILCEELDGLSTSMGEEWRASVAQLAAGYTEVIEKTDVPLFLKTLSDELREYQKLRGGLEETSRQLDEVCRLLSQETVSFRSLVRDNLAETRAVLDSGIRDLKASDQAVVESLSALRHAMYEFCANIKQELDRSLEHASRQYSGIRAQQEQAESKLLALSQDARSLANSLETGQKTSLEAILNTVRDLALKQRRMIHRTAVVVCIGIGASTVVAVLVNHLVW